MNVPDFIIPWLYRWEINYYITSHSKKAEALKNEQIKKPCLKKKSLTAMWCVFFRSISITEKITQRQSG